MFQNFRLNVKTNSLGNKTSIIFQRNLPDFGFEQGGFQTVVKNYKIVKKTWIFLIL
jgi:hypothetical protein